MHTKYSETNAGFTGNTRKPAHNSKPHLKTNPISAEKNSYRYTKKL